jgi:hypothetical protein
METHILNGDALIDRVQAAGFDNFIVCRECLVDGPVIAQSMDEFWKMRAAFLEGNQEEDQGNYFDYVVPEFDKLKQIPPGSDINLWFGDDLFCQTNLWFVVNYLDQLGLSNNIYRVYPIIKSEERRWDEYGGLTAGDFAACYEKRVLFTAADIELAKHLWKAYMVNDLELLKSLSLAQTNVFRDLPKVIQAHIDRFAQPGRPQRVLQEIINSGKKDFNEIFPAFFKKEGIYGFGDTQVKKILGELT